MLLAIYTAGAIIPIGMVLFLVLYAIFRRNSQVILCTECQQCKAACPLLAKGCNPVEIMLAAKSGTLRQTMEKGGRLCVGCGKCQEACPRGLTPHKIVEKCRKETPPNRGDRLSKQSAIAAAFFLLFALSCLLGWISRAGAGPVVLDPPAEAGPLRPDSPIVAQALCYLKACQREDGGFGEGGATEWVTLAIASAGQDPRNWHREGNTPLDYLRQKPITRNPYDWIRMVLALASMGEDPKTFGGVDHVRMIKERYREGQFDDPLSLRDDYWALLALASAGEGESPEAQGSAAFILRHQNPDGSWSASTTGIETCADNTAVAICALLASGIQRDSEPIRKAIAYLRTAQFRDGGFPYLFMPSNSATDAWVMQAIWASGGDPSLWKAGGCSVFQHLLSLQQVDGSFRWTADTTNSEILMTAYAVPALLGRWHPLDRWLSGDQTVDVRVEGEYRTFLYTRVSLSPKAQPNALSALVEAAKKANADLTIEKEEDCLYLKGVEGESDGWQYRVNDFLPMEPADKYPINGGAEIVWFYDPHGWKSPLRVLPAKTTAWTGESIFLLVEQYDDRTERWLHAEDTILMAGGRSFPVSGGWVKVPFPLAGIFEVYAEKPGGVRSLRKKLIVEERRVVTVRLRLEDGGNLIYKGQVSFSGLSTRDLNGRPVDVKRPVLLGALEAARREGDLTYRVIRTAEGLILESVNGLSEDNRSGSWWFRVNGENVLLDADEYEMKEGDELHVYRSRHPMQNVGKEQDSVNPPL